MVGYRENQLDMLGVRANVHDWRHVGYFHEVHCMLERKEEEKDGYVVDKLVSLHV